MDKSELVELLSPEGLRLLDSVPAYAERDVVSTVARLRAAGSSPTLVSAVLTQARLRAKATGKFGDFASRMLFTDAGLEQATRLPVAALHARRFRDAGVARVADLGCGIGGDAMAMSALDLEVLAVDADDVTAILASYNLAPFPAAAVEHARAQDVDTARVEAVFLDPARRTTGHRDTRRIDPDAYSPPLDFALDTARSLPTGIKLGPGLDRDLIPNDAEAQWISVDGALVEMGLWFGAVSRPGIRRAALVLSGTRAAELVGASDAPDAEVRSIGEYVYEPDGAVIRARLIGDLARSLDAGMVSESIAWLTTDSPRPTPFARGFRVTDTLPFDESRVKRLLRDRRIGSLEIKKRGIDLDPAVLRKRLSLRGDGSATLIVTRVAGRHTALLAERVD
ncbi:class I SAM-dependent methyltransferase [Planctomonas psychrotolerans]|uniref:class I SAM-dependent methyltransferase n=1 Tax=Planctomonas psychrotolerans TaxID=2528712 RepID=UPI00123C6E9D|nr:class I SAM-dependent methyltransferase [Planctomonas psychrotolerans]